ncbi:anthranilate synthase component II [Pseudomonadota bacterium]
MILVIDNYDSFTFNLVQYLGELGEQPLVYRNDKISLDEIDALKPEHILISPGPCTPHEAGISKTVIERFSGHIPILGVCLGHQSIGEVFGGNIIRAPRLMHGKTSPIEHNGQGIFKGVPSPFTATRYHSLIVEEPLPEVLIRTAWTSEGELMGLQHHEHPTFGVQFHPESILTEHGHQMLKNFLET